MKQNNNIMIDNNILKTYDINNTQHRFISNIDRTNNNNNNMLMNIKNIINNGEITKISYCTLSLYTLWTNNKVFKVCLSALLLRKLYKVYSNNKDTIDDILDSIL